MILSWYTFVILPFPIEKISLHDLQVFFKGLKCQSEREEMAMGSGHIAFGICGSDMVLQCNAIFYVFVTTGKKAEAKEEEKLSWYNIDMRVWRPSYRVSSLSQGDFCFVVMSILYYSHLWSQIGRGVPWIVSIHAIGGGHTTSGRTS